MLPALSHLLHGHGRERIALHCVRAGGRTGHPTPIGAPSPIDFPGYE